MKQRLQHLLLTGMIVFFASTGYVSGQYLTSTQTIGSGSNQLDISVSIDASLSQAKFVITGPATLWFGFSFNTTSMAPGSYTILANVSGGNPAEYIMVNHAAPTLQPVQNLTGITSSTAAGRKTFTFYRNLSTGDPNDYTFTATTGNLNIAWAYGSTLALGYHDDRGSSSLNFINPCSSNPTTTLPPIQICAGDSALIFGQYQTVAGNYTQTYPMSWACDSIVLQPLVVNQSGYSILDTLLYTLCQGDSVMIGNQYYHAAGMIMEPAGTAGCDTLVHLHIITQVVIDTNVSVIGFSLNAIPGYDQYHWIDCATGLTAPGSTNLSVYTPMVAGQYKVEITSGTCTAISNCHAAGVTGTEEVMRKLNNIVIYPNPAKDLLHISMEQFTENMSVRIFDLTGKLIAEIPVEGSSLLQVSLSQIPNGTYIMALTGNGLTRQEVFSIAR